MGKMSELDLAKQEYDLLDKGAIPRITQEIYYICSSDGSKVVNLDLTLERFGDKLRRIEPTTLDDMWICGYCGSEEVEEQVWRNINTKKTITVNDYHQCNNCQEECSPMTYFDWQEKIAEECMGNKDKYHKIIDGSRA